VLPVILVILLLALVDLPPCSLHLLVFTLLPLEVVSVLRILVPVDLPPIQLAAHLQPMEVYQ